jgi:flagellar protein FlaJ
MYLNERSKKLVYFVSIVLATVFLSLLIRSVGYNPNAPYWIPLRMDINNIISYSILLAILPPSIIEFLNNRWLEGVEKNVPRVLNDVTEEVKSGQSLINALESNMVTDYGPISRPMKNALVRFSLTSNFSDAMNWLGEKLIVPIGKQMSSIFIESYETGGNVTDVLMSSVELFKGIDDDRTHRRGQTRPYIFIIYTGLIVFLLISFVLLNQFLVHLQFTNDLAGLSQAGIKLSSININYYESILFWAAAIESLIGGMVAGKIAEGKISAGLIHSSLMLVVTLLFYNFVV